jgi:tryptophanyl-tRNA synthetase
MSKSDENPNSRIHLTDDDSAIKAKISRAVTDSDLIENYETMLKKERAGPLNLLSIISALSNKDIQSVCIEYDGENFAKVKKDLTELAISIISPIRSKTMEYIKNKDYLIEVLKNGAIKARKIAAATKKEVYECFYL